MECVNAMYQSGYIGSDVKGEMANLILIGMDTGDYTELIGFMTENYLCKIPENPFWDQMQEILSEELEE